MHGERMFPDLRNVCDVRVEAPILVSVAQKACGAPVETETLAP
jgi:hypothetical protein